MITKPPLPYPLDSLEPHISKETLEYHSGKHHQTYVDTLNTLITGTDFESLELEAIVKQAPKWPIFNNAAQVWNHTFYFDSLTKPIDHAKLSGSLSEEIEKHWWTFEAFQREFSEKALKTFWSGWVWLVKRSNNNLDIISTSNAETPLANGDTPLLTCDVWEHAYYIDYRNARAKYIENFWKVVNWRIVSIRNKKV